MLIDMIDYHEPTLVIVGSRGLAKIKGMLLGSVSNYLIQKSSVPVMVSFDVVCIPNSGPLSSGQDGRE